jgi:hypothetical protein
VKKKHPLLTLQNEEWLLRRLRELGCGMLDEGVTTAEQRRENVRQAILRQGLRMCVLGRGAEGKAATAEAVFERLYGEELEAEQGAA